MPQSFQVLKCYKCYVFQVHQTKKSNKWECKLCGEKQSIKRHYGLGTAKDCRMHVQKLNGIRGEIEELVNQKAEGNNDNIENEVCEIKTNIDNLQPKKSKWSEYVEKETEIVKTSEEVEYLGDIEVILDIPSKRPRTVCKKNNFKHNGINKSVKDKCDEIMYSKHPFNNEAIEPSLHGNACIPKDVVQFVENNSIYEKAAFNKFTPLSVQCSSKWAQFVDADGDDEKDNECTDNSKTLFSLCDDNDLDNVLDF